MVIMIDNYLQNHESDQINDDAIGRTSRTNGADEKCIQYFR
jgi:hypothetical protein